MAFKCLKGNTPIKMATAIVSENGVTYLLSDIEVESIMSIRLKKLFKL